MKLVKKPSICHIGEPGRPVAVWVAADEKRVRARDALAWETVQQMWHFTPHGLVIFCSLAIGAAAPFASQANAQPGFEISMPKIVQPAADEAAFASKQEAEEFLARTLPIATAGNPRYRSEEPGVTTAWITKTVKFGPGKSGHGRLVSMSEEVLGFRNGVQVTTGSHDVAFLIEDVKIAENRDPGTLTESGDISLGVIFNCNSGKCIQSSYDGKQSMTESGDISIQDAALRSKILKAFETLK